MAQLKLIGTIQVSWLTLNVYMSELIFIFKMIPKILKIGLRSGKAWYPSAYGQHNLVISMTTH
jgi:hypothetical protein